jgi:hypothetical protein
MSLGWALAWGNWAIKHFSLFRFWIIGPAFLGFQRGSCLAQNGSDLPWNLNRSRIRSFNYNF